MLCNKLDSLHRIFNLGIVILNMHWVRSGTGMELFVGKTCQLQQNMSITAKHVKWFCWLVEGSCPYWSAVQCSAVQCSAVQAREQEYWRPAATAAKGDFPEISAVQCSAVQCSVD
jgi:hypothetical protein